MVCFLFFNLKTLLDSKSAPVCSRRTLNDANNPPNSTLLNTFIEMFHSSPPTQPNLVLFR